MSFLRGLGVGLMPFGLVSRRPFGALASRSTIPSRTTLPNLSDNRCPSLVSQSRLFSFASSSHSQIWGPKYPDIPLNGSCIARNSTLRKAFASGKFGGRIQLQTSRALLQKRSYHNGRNFNSNQFRGGIFTNIFINAFLLLRAVWAMVPDFLKLFLGFMLTSYFLIFVALPVLFVGLPVLFILGFLFVRARRLFQARILKTYSEYLRTSTLKLSGNNTVGFSNYNHPVKLHRLQSLVSRRINLAFEFNENNIQKVFGAVSSSKTNNTSFVDHRSFETRFQLSDLISVRSESVITSNAAMRDSNFDYVLIYEFLLFEKNLRNPKTLRNAALVNLVVGKPKRERGGLDENEAIFEELFENRFEDDEEQPCIIEVVPLGLSLTRFVIDSQSEFDTTDTDRIITVNKHKTRTYNN